MRRGRAAARSALRAVALLSILACACAHLVAAEAGASSKDKVPYFDDQDGKLDLSRRLEEAHGFIPLPILITEPALGGWGGGLGLVFVQRPAADSSLETHRRTPPDLTGGVGAYTENGTWFAGGGRMATLPKQRLRYRAGAGYGNVNLDFYQDLPSGDTRGIGFNLRSTPVYLFLGRMLRDPRFTVGGQYTFAATKVKLANSDETLPPYVTGKNLDSNISALGLAAEFDSRDNIFTPDSGWLVHADYNWSKDWLGSDYDYGRLDSYAFWYAPVGKSWHEGRNWVSGLRLDWQQSYGNPPFYLLPFVNLRGIPTMRYQGRSAVVVETEQRFDWSLRYSAVVFGGVGKAFEKPSEASDADTLYSYGAGVRYLIARQFKIRVGVDVAKGPEDWAYYVVFGSAWFR